jgi:hypothetical protein
MGKWIPAPRREFFAIADRGTYLALNAHLDLPILKATKPSSMSITS